VNTAEGACEFVLPILRRALRWADRVWLRIDAGFPGPELLEPLEERRILYVGRLKNNAALERLAREHLEQYHGADGEQTFELLYRAGSWSRARRVVLVVPNHRQEHEGLFPDHFFLLSHAPGRGG
jgi:hypothetical protein